MSRLWLSYSNSNVGHFAVLRAPDKLAAELLLRRAAGDNEECILTPDLIELHPNGPDTVIALECWEDA
jgi:hypothetical protein